MTKFTIFSQKNGLVPLPSVVSPLCLRRVLKALNANPIDPGKMVADKNWRLSGLQIIEKGHLCH